MGTIIRCGWMLMFLLFMCLFSSFALAANTPCSGKKGGIDRCDGELFLCNDGSISASKKVAPPFMAPLTRPVQMHCCRAPMAARAVLAPFAPGLEVAFIA